MSSNSDLIVGSVNNFVTRIPIELIELGFSFRDAAKPYYQKGLYS
jgi:hypothetical protein